MVKLGGRGSLGSRSPGIRGDDAHPQGREPQVMSHLQRAPPRGTPSPKDGDQACSSWSRPALSPSPQLGAEVPGRGGPGGHPVGPGRGEITQAPRARAQPRGHPQHRPSEAPGAICIRHPHVLTEHDPETRVHRRVHKRAHTMVPWAPAVPLEEPPLCTWMSPLSAPGGAPALPLEEPALCPWRSPRSAPGGAPTPPLEEPGSAPGGAPALPLEEPLLCPWTERGLRAWGKALTHASCSCPVLP